MSSKSIYTNKQIQIGKMNCTQTILNIRYAMLLLLLGMGAAGIAGEWRLDGNAFRADTVSNVLLANGMEQTHIILSNDGGRKIQLYVVRADLREKGLGVRSFSGMDMSHGLEEISHVMKRAAAGGMSYLCGVNADFFTFKDGITVGSQVMDGEVLVNQDQDGWCYMGVTRRGLPFISKPAAFVSCVISGKDTIFVDRINRSHDKDEWAMYTGRYGSSTGSEPCPELVLCPTGRTSILSYGKPMRCKPVTLSTTGNCAIPDGCVVLSAPASEAEHLATLSHEGRLKVMLDVDMPGVRSRDIAEMVGGRPLILSDGKPLDTMGELAHLPQLHPRTAVGYSSDRRYLTLMVVDGRSEQSSGMTGRELADAMSEAGCTEALNLDGGGSSSLYTARDGTVNVPSDGRERKVSNGIGIVRMGNR